MADDYATQSKKNKGRINVLLDKRRRLLARSVWRVTIYEQQKTDEQNLCAKVMIIRQFQ